MKKLLFWAPRILAILFSMFIMLFSFDVFDGTISIINQMIGFFMHNIPVLIMILIIVLAWKKDIIGMIGFGLMTIILFIMVTSSMSREGTAIHPAVFIISGPALLIALLYGLNWYLSKHS